MSILLAMALMAGRASAPQDWRCTVQVEQNGVATGIRSSREIDFRLDRQARRVSTRQGGGAWQPVAGMEHVVRWDRRQLDLSGSAGSMHFDLRTLRLASRYDFPQPGGRVDRVNMDGSCVLLAPGT